MPQIRKDARPARGMALAALCWALWPGLGCEAAPGSAAPANAVELPLKDRVSQYGITWYFESPAPVGQFINGDFYVVGPVTVKMINPKPQFGSEVSAPKDADNIDEPPYDGKLARNGSTLNLPAVVSPDATTSRTHRSGFDSRMPMMAYDPGQYTPLPIAMKPGDSLVSSASAPPPCNGYPIKSVAILTCMDEPQPKDAFRPSFCQTATCTPYQAGNLRRDLLLRLPVPGEGAGIKPQDYAEFFQEPWIDTVYGGRAMPKKKFQFYGAQIAELGGAASLLLLLDYPAADKEPLLINMVQTGIDLFGLLRGGGEWHAEGGGNAGRKWLILFAGLMLDDAQMYDMGKSPIHGRFHEDEQTQFCPVEYDGRTFESGWTGSRVIWTGHYGYYRGQFSRARNPMNHYGPVDLFPPSEWPGPWSEGSEGYRRNSTSSSWVAQALAARLMNAEPYWDHDAFFAYVDRWMTEDDTKYMGILMQNMEEKLAAAQTEEDKRNLEAVKEKISKAAWSGTVTSRPELADLVKKLWQTYRNNLPPAKDGKIRPRDTETWK